MQRIRTLLVARTERVGLPLLMCVCVAALNADAVEIAEETARQGPAPAVTEADRQATQALIDMTRTAPLLIQNFHELLNSPPTVTHEYDRGMLLDEFGRRFVFDGPWISVIDEGQSQSLCWVAECNKRMLWRQPDVRARQRDRLLARILELLEVESAASNVCGLLDAAYRTTFYSGCVVPQAGADAIISLFMEFIPNDEPMVHEFACDRLRRMGYVWRPRHDEVLQFLLREAPDLRASLSADPAAGVNADALLGPITETTCGEEEYLAISIARPQELAAIIETHPTREPLLLNILGDTALMKLTNDACMAGGADAAEWTAQLVRKGVRIHQIVFIVSDNVARERSWMDNRNAQRCLDEVLIAFEQTAGSDWPPHEQPLLASYLDRIQNTIRERYGEHPASPALEFVDERLAETAQAIRAQAEK